MSDRSTELVVKTATEALGLSADAESQRASAVFLDRLAKSEFFPDQLVRESASYLRAPRSDIASLPNLNQAVEKALANQVETFAEAYWQIPTSTRNAQWEELMLECERFPRLAGRLASLEGGLDMDPPSGFDDPADARLAAVIVELYPLKPAARAERRRYLLSETGSAVERRHVARKLSLRSCNLGAIDHGLLEMILLGRPALPSPTSRTSEAREKTRANHDVVTRANKENESLHERYERSRDEDLDFDHETRSGTRENDQPRNEKIVFDRKPDSSNSWDWRWITIPCLILFMGLIRNIGKDSGSPSTPPQSSSSSRPYSLKENGPILPFADSANPDPTPNPPLTHGQIGLLLDLGKLDSLSSEEAVRLGAKFLVLRRPDPAAVNPTLLHTWDTFQKTVLNERQQYLVTRLQASNLKVDTVRDLMIAFVNARDRQPEAGKK